MKNFIKSFGVLFLVVLTVNCVKANAQSCNLEILSTNDVHGRLLPFELGVSDYNRDVSGVARRFTLVNKIRKNNKKYNILLLDAGDIAQGSIFYDFYGGLPDIKFMNKLKYDAASIGNHDFDNGTESLKKMIEVAEFPFVNANYKFPKDSPVYDKIEPYIIKEFEGCKVGIIGLLTDEERLILKIDTGTKIYEPLKMAKKYIKKIDKQTDVIILLTHIGFEEDKKLASLVENVDIIVGSHSHTTLKKPVFVDDLKGQPVIIVQAGEYGKYLSDLKVKVKDDSVDLKSYKLHNIDSCIDSDPEVEKELLELKKESEKISNEIVGETLTSLNFIRGEIRSKETSGGNFFVDAIKKSFPDVDVVFQNGGGIRTDKIVPPGKITVAQLHEIYPFDNEVILFELKGKYLKPTLERSVASLPFSSGGFLQIGGITFTADLSEQPQIISKKTQKIKQKGNRVKDVLINGKPLDPEKYYKIAANGYLLNGGNGHIFLNNNSINIKPTGITVPEVIEKYLRSFSPISSKVENKIKVINIPNNSD